MRRLLNKKREKVLLTRDDLRAAFFDDFGAPYSVCRPPRPGSHDNLSASVAMVVMEPAVGEMDVVLLPALNRVYTGYSLTAEPEVLTYGQTAGSR